MVEATTMPDIKIGRGDLPVMGNISGMGAGIMSVGGSIHDFYDLMNVEYGGMVKLFLQNTCPGATNDKDISVCRDFSLEAFAKSLDPCGGYFIVAPGAKGLRSCTTDGMRIELGGERYPGWTELTPKNYDAFTKEGRVALAYCDGSGSAQAHDCGVLLDEAETKLPRCSAVPLKRGYVDVSRYPELRYRHTDEPQAMALLEDGKRYEITVPNLSPQMLKLVVCGAEELMQGLRAPGQ
jgi:hypothetical protein